MTVGLLSFSAQGFNGGRSQIGPGQLGFAPVSFINMAKLMTNPTVAGGSENGFLVSPALQDANGYATDLPSGGTGTRANAPRVNPSERGNTPIVVRWTGTWTLTGSAGTAVSNNVTAATNSTNATLTVGASHYYRAGQKVAISGFAAPFTALNGNNYEIQSVTSTTITLIGANSSAFGAYVSGGAVTNSLLAGSVGGRYVFTPAEASSPNVQLGFSKAGSTYVSLIEAMYVDEEALYDAGAVFSPHYISLLRDTLRVGKIRFMDWQGGSSGINTSNVTTWNSLKSESYISYVADEWKPSLWISTVTVGSSAITSPTGSTNDYAIIFGSGNWTDKQTVQLRFPSTASAAQSTITFSGTVGSGDLVVNWTAHGFSSGVPIACFGVSGGATCPQPISFATNMYVGTVIDANSFKVSLTPGGANVTRTSAGTGTFAALRPATLSINGNTPVIIRSPYGDAAVSGSQPAINSYATLIYDADLNSLLLNQHAAYGGGLINGVPPSLLFRLCKEVGTHCYVVAPYLAVDPMTDYVTQMMTAAQTYIAANAPWMKIGIEGPNETWNSGLGFYATRYGWNKSYAHWPTTPPANPGFDQDNWYGKVISTIGQDAQTVFNNDRTKYEVYLGVRESNGETPTLNDPRLNATAYVAQSAAAQSGYLKNPGYMYATHGVTADYIVPGYYGYAPEMSLAYDYAINGNAAALDTYVNSLLINGMHTGNLLKLSQRITGTATYFAGPWGGSYVLGLQGYEGGSDAEDASGNSTSVVTAATNDATGAVLTQPTSFINGNNNGATSSNNPTNAAMVGMMFAVTGASGGTWNSLITGAAQTVTITSGTADIPYTSTAVVGQGMNFTAANVNSTLPSNIANGVTYWIISVNAGVSVQVSTTKGGSALVPSGGTGTATIQPGWVVKAINVGADPTKVQIDVDSSGFGTYTASSATVTYINGINYQTTLRRAVRTNALMQGFTFGAATSCYQTWLNAGGTFPSQYQLLNGTGSAWGIYQPSTYSIPSPQAAGIASFNH